MDKQQPAPPPAQQAPPPALSLSTAAQQQQSQRAAPPTHRPLTHNPPSPTAGTRAPWAQSPATGSPFPQLARPADNAVGVISGAPTADRMSPTAAPWVAAPAMGPPSSQLITGRPVQGVIQAEPRMPDRAGGPFRAPTKAIQDAEGLKAFLAGSSARAFVGFILSLSEAVAGTKLTQAFELPRPLAALKGMLDELWGLVDATPPVAQSLRYGNPAFRTWHAAMAEAAPGMMATLLPPELSGAAVELLPYWLESFGNSTRIDYGTGHETNFAALLYCLAALGLVGPADRAALVCVVFNRYLELMRHVQTTYWLEPAGSHGVWGLDDYQFLPFVWGAAQLAGHPVIRPKSIHNAELLAAGAPDYMYLAAVQFVKTVKKGALAETSPMLDDVSSVPGWAKVAGGMVKMYQVEVLSKFPIMQHFLFGSLLPLA
ncbi:hypothetical protein HT031_002626 [Scenedesmus sp. PABB004]|nr:hypothetical protein HT031_002626 [Scenedesmus sp. PABB004]